MRFCSLYSQLPCCFAKAKIRSTTSSTMLHPSQVSAAGRFECPLKEIPFRALPTTATAEPSKGEDRRAPPYVYGSLKRQAPGDLCWAHPQSTSTGGPMSRPVPKLSLSKRFRSKKRAVEVASKVSRLNAAATQQVSSSRLQRNWISTSRTAPRSSPSPSLFPRRCGDTVGTCTIDIAPTSTIDIARIVIQLR